MVLVVVGFVTLMLGVLDVGDNPLNFVYLSIGSCILAGVFLIVGVLRSRPSKTSAPAPSPGLPAAGSWSPPAGQPPDEPEPSEPVSGHTEPLTPQPPPASPPGGRSPGSMTQSLLRDRGPQEHQTTVQNVSAEEEPVDEEGEPGGVDADERIDDGVASWQPPESEEYLDEEAGEAISPAATGPTASEPAGRKTGAKKAGKKSGTKKAAAKKASAKKTAGKKSAAKKAGQKAGTKKAAGKKAAAKKAAGKKSAAKKTAGKKAAAKKSTGAAAPGLEAVSGLGPTKQQRLLDRFGSVEAIRSASADEIAEVDGVSTTLARQVKDQLG